jgi:pimeloyl-ACP methyl ester carboxylesterase
MPRGTVLYVHGLWMTGAEGLWLRRQLAMRGWRTRNFAWSSMCESLDAAALRCAGLIQRLAQQQGPVHVLGHSLGGLLVHRALEHCAKAPSPSPDSAVGHVVFLASPLQGSEAARWLARTGAGRLLLGRAGSALGETQVRRWTHSVPAAVIAGTRYAGPGRWLGAVGPHSDGTVAVAETRLEGARLHRDLPVTHHGMLWSHAVADEVAAFLEGDQ